MRSKFSSICAQKCTYFARKAMSEKYSKTRVFRPFVVPTEISGAKDHSQDFC